MQPRTCRYCGDTIRLEGNIWVDDTEGDVCSGTDDTTNEGGLHTP